jgi:hypothetical protein
LTTTFSGVVAAAGAQALTTSARATMLMTNNLRDDISFLLLLIDFTFFPGDMLTADV